MVTKANEPKMVGIREMIDEYTCGPFYYHGLTLIPAWISNHQTSKMWDAIT